MEQGSVMRLAGIPIESKFYLVGNAVIARGLFRYTAAAGLGAPVRICVSQRDGGCTSGPVRVMPGLTFTMPAGRSRPADLVAARRLAQS